MTDKMELTKHHGAEYVGRSVNPNKCAARVYDGWRWNQCLNKRHPDTLDGAFCKLHCPDRRKARQDARYAKQRADNAAARAEREKAARQAELKDEAVQLLTDIAGRVASNSWAVANASAWLAKWKAAQ